MHIVDTICCLKFELSLLYKEVHHVFSEANIGRFVGQGEGGKEGLHDSPLVCHPF